MAYYLTKLLISSLLIVVVSELAKRESVWAGALASIPLVSVLAIIWLYIDTGDVQKIQNLSTDIFWLVLPSLALFVLLPLMLKAGFSFVTSLSTGIGITALLYAATIYLLNGFSN